MPIGRSVSGSQSHDGHIGLSATELQRRALRGVSTSTISSTLALPLAIVVSAVVARSLGPEEFARFAYLAFVVPMILQVTDAGYAQATARWASQAVASGDLSAAGELAGKLVGWNLVRLPLVLGLILVVAHPVPAVALAVIVFGLVAGAGSGLVVSLTAENRVGTTAKIGLLQALAASAVGVASVLAGASGTTVWALSFASGIVAAPGWLLTANPRLRRAALRPRLPRRLPSGFWRFGLAASAASAGYTLVFSRSEVIILQALDRHRALAVFALAYGLAQRLTTPIDTLLGPLIPALSGLTAAHPERLRPGFERALRLSTAAAAFLGAAAVTGTMLAAPLLFGSEYVGIGPAFVALAAISLLQSAAQPYTALAHARGRPGVTLAANVPALAVDVALSFAFIPSLNIWGAVIANAAAALVAVSLTARAAAGPTSVRLARIRGFSLTGLALVSAGIAYAAALATAPVAPSAAVVTAFAVGAVTFVLLAKAVGGLLPRDDVNVLLASLPGPIADATRSTVLMLSRKTSP